MDLNIGKKATKRGLKYCQSCNYPNGVRANQCKNCKVKLINKNQSKTKVIASSTENQTPLNIEDFTSLNSFSIENLLDVPVQILGDNDPHEVLEMPSQEVNIVNILDTQDFEFSDIQIELMDEFNITDKIELPGEYPEPTNIEEFDFAEEEILKAESEEINDKNRVNQKIQVINKFLVRKLLKNHESAIQSQPGKLNLNTFIKLLASNGVLLNKVKVNEANSVPVFSPEVITLEFNQWLNSVIERIHLEMDFNGNEDSKELKFYVSHNFFKCLSARFSITNKKRMPNMTLQILDGPHKGLQQYVWIFNSLSLVKQIFQTELLRIEDEQKFTKISDNPSIYVKFTSENSQELEKFSTRGVLILPKLYSTKIKVNPKIGNERENEFKISWTPNYLIVSQHGELKINFKFERRNRVGGKV